MVHQMRDHHNAKSRRAGPDHSEKAEEQAPVTQKATIGQAEKGAITTAIHIPKQSWNLGRAVAFRRAQQSGGRVSVSRLIAGLIERHRLELERELKPE